MYVRIVSSIGIDRMARTLRRTHSLPNLTTIVSAPSISTLRMEQELPLGIYLPDNVETMRRYVFNTIIDRLQASSVNTHSVSMEQLDFLLPKSGIVYWQLLLDFPMCTTDLELSYILPMALSTPISPDPFPGTTIYYIRSFRLSYGQLLYIVERWERKG